MLKLNGNANNQPHRIKHKITNAVPAAVSNVFGREVKKRSMHRQILIAPPINPIPLVQ